MMNWNFPSGKRLSPTGINNGDIEMFLDNIGDSLTREVIQNSLDASNDELNKPVRVEFSIFKLKTQNIPGLHKIKNEILPKAKEYWQDIPDTLKFLNQFEDVINHDQVSVLRVSDFNTKGLTDRNYKSLVNGNGFSVKESVDSAGSKGIGKAAPFAASDLRMVFYNSYSTEEMTRSIGIMNFVSYWENKEKEILTQFRGSYVEENQDYNSQQMIFNQKQRYDADYGTDIFIIGLKEFEQWNQKITESTLNNFFMSILDNKLEVNVNGEEISSNNIRQKMKVYEKLIEGGQFKGSRKLELQRTLNYFNTIVNDKHLVINLDERFDKYNFIETLEDAKLTIDTSEVANRTILQTRKAGMRINERNRISSNINFTGIFQATGKKLNEFLKDLENANHDKWSADRKQRAEHKIANEFLVDLFHWYKDAVRDNFGVKNENIIDAIGVSDLLPLEMGESGGNNKKDSGIINQFSEETTINRKKRVNYPIDETTTDEILEEIIDEIGIGEGDTSGLGAVREGLGDGNNPEIDKAPGTDSGEYGSDDTNENSGVAKIEKKVGLSKVEYLKILEIDSSMGEYRIVGKILKSVTEIEISLKSIGENGTAYNVKILSADSKIYNAKVVKNAIRVKGLKKGNRFMINVVLKSKLRIKMEGLLSEIKS